MINSDHHYIQLILFHTLNLKPAKRFNILFNLKCVYNSNNY